MEVKININVVHQPWQAGHFYHYHLKISDDHPDRFWLPKGNEHREFIVAFHKMTDWCTKNFGPLEKDMIKASCSRWQINFPRSVFLRDEDDVILFKLRFG